MPSLAAAVRAAGARDFSADPHHGGPCDCTGAAALLRHRRLPSPDQSRYGRGKPVRFNRRRSMSYTSEGGGFVATCLGCGWMTWNPDKGVVSKRVTGHEKCPAPPKRKRK